MAKFDTQKRIARGIQPGLAPIMGNMMPIGQMGSKSPMPIGNEGDMQLHGQMDSGNNLLSPSFESIMNRNPSTNDSVGKRAIGTKPALMNKFNNTY